MTSGRDRRRAGRDRPVDRNDAPDPRHRALGRQRADPVKPPRVSGLSSGSTCLGPPARCRPFVRRGALPGGHRAGLELRPGLGGARRRAAAARPDAGRSTLRSHAGGARRRDPRAGARQLARRRSHRAGAGALPLRSRLAGGRLRVPAGYGDQSQPSRGAPRVRAPAARDRPSGRSADARPSRPGARSPRSGDDRIPRLAQPLHWQVRGGARELRPRLGSGLFTRGDSAACWGCWRR